MGARHASGQGGFSIVEVLVAITLLTVGILGALVMIDSANGTTAANRARTSGVNLAREVTEGSRAIQETVPYAALSTGCATPSSPSNPCAETSAIVAALQSQPGLASTGTGGWKIVREGTTYTIKVSICSMDDPSDGLGNHSSDGPYCADAGAGGTADSSPDDYKRLIADVSWSGTRSTQSTRSVALLQSNGVNAPAISCLRPTSSPCPDSSAPLVNQSGTTTLPFTATLSGPAANRVVWYVDGAFKGTVTPSGGSAAFTWNLGTVGSGTEVFDGSYEVSAKAFDVNGQAGTSGSVQVQINRRVPAAPGSYAAGRDTLIAGNGSIGGVDVDWLPVPDKDVLYYRIYRKVGTAAATMLAQTTDTGQTSYTDRTPPANPTTWTAACSNPRQAAASALRYYVVAVDQNGTTPREGTQTASVDVNACNTAPKNPPTNALQLTTNANGTLTLTGALPASPTDNDSGDKVTAVRVYRWTGTAGPSAPGDRLALVPFTGSSFSFTDAAPHPNGTPLKYCFTNVDQVMQESICSNVVSG